MAYPKQTPPPDRWVERFNAVRNASRVVVKLMPDERELPTESSDAYEQCNLWMIRGALAHGADRVRFICLWNGAGGDGPGGTAHLMERVRAAGGQATWIDTRKLW